MYFIYSWPISVYNISTGYLLSFQKTVRLIRAVATEGSQALLLGEPFPSASGMVQGMGNGQRQRQVQAVRRPVITRGLELQREVSPLQTQPLRGDPE